jgi:hypothetical protein
MDDAEDVVAGLKAQPSVRELAGLLRRFKDWAGTPSSETASVVYVLVNTTLPELWTSLDKFLPVTQLLIQCLSTVTGVNALLLRLNQPDSLDSTKQSVVVSEVLDVLTHILDSGHFTPRTVLEGLLPADDRGRILLNEYISLIGGSKILNVASKAAVATDVTEFWICDGRRYTTWLARGIAAAVRENVDIDAEATLLGKALSLGYPSSSTTHVVNVGSVIEGLLPDLLNHIPLLSAVILNLRRTTTILFTRHLLSYLTSRFLDYTVSRTVPRWWDSDRSRVGAVASVLCELYSSQQLTSILVQVVQNTWGMDSLAIQRACILAVASIGEQFLTSLTDYFLALWTDKGFINHTPISAQESTPRGVLC